MIRIAGRNLNGKKQLKFAITPIKGIGKSNVRQVIKLTFDAISSDSKIKFDLNLEDLAKISLDKLPEEVLVILRNTIESNYLIEDDLRRQKQADIRRLVDLNTWRGIRHSTNMPVRGQTTRTNSRTVRGNKRNTKGSGKIKAQKT
jgi:small subunit ribosomal protein S13